MEGVMNLSVALSLRGLASAVNTDDQRHDEHHHQGNAPGEEFHILNVDTEVILNGNQRLGSRLLTTKSQSICL